MQYKAIIFDFFGVISSEVAPYWFEKYFSKNDIILLKEKYVSPADIGAISEAELFNTLAKLTENSPETIRQEWLHLAVIDSAFIPFINNLRNKYKIALLSNAPHLFLDEIIRKNNLTLLFDSVVISSNVNLVKPNPAIFELVLKELNTQPNEAVFLDDNPSYVKGAESLGIKSFQFLNFTKLKNDFKNIGIV